jgi:[protein-PII] uridylyltransferase
VTRVRRRHGVAGEVAFLLEPDLKEGQGGLRDVHALTWAQLARDVLLEGDAMALHDAEDVLLDVRVALHRLSGSGNDQLTLDRQDEVATMLGHRDADEVMSRVSSAARTVAWIGDEAWHRIATTVRGPRAWAMRRDRPVEGLPDLDGFASRIDSRRNVSHSTMALKFRPVQAEMPFTMAL